MFQLTLEVDLLEDEGGGERSDVGIRDLVSGRTFTSVAVSNLLLSI